MTLDAIHRRFDRLELTCYPALVYRFEICLEHIPENPVPVN